MKCPGYNIFIKCVISGNAVVNFALLLLLFVFLLASQHSFALEAAVTPTAVKQESTESMSIKGAASAPENAGPASAQDSIKEPVAERTLLSVFDAPRDYLSEKVVSYAKNVDQFFCDERYFQEHNKSVIQLEFNETLQEGGNSVFAFEGKAKLDFPAAEKRFRFVIESNPEKKTAGEVKKDQVSTIKETPAKEQYAASLRYEKEEESNFNFSSELGAKLQFPLDPFVRTRGSYSKSFDDWRLKISETVFWFNTIGLGETTQIDMERLLSPPVLFRATSTVTCFEAPQNCDLRQDFTVYNTLSDRAVIQHQASVIGFSQPKFTETAYVLLSRYRYRLHKDWVFYEISPQMNFPRTDGFKMNTLLLLRLEVLLGATK